MAIKAKKLFTKNVLILLGKNETKTNVFQLCCGEVITLVTLVENLESYIEMVAGLPKINKINDQELLRAN
jgi:hypothetical protein